MSDGMGVPDSDKIAALNKLWQSNDNKLTPEQIVDAASDESSALHSYFVWDDSRAAYLYRLTQARHLIRYVVEPDLDYPIATYVREVQAYVPTREVIKDTEAWRSALREMDLDIQQLVARKEKFISLGPSSVAAKFKKHTADILRSSAKLTQLATDA